MKHSNDPKDKDKLHHKKEDLSDLVGRPHTSDNAVRTTDMDNEAFSSGRNESPSRGSGISTKNTVSGSDFDGQVSD